MRDQWIMNYKSLMKATVVLLKIQYFLIWINLKYLQQASQKHIKINDFLRYISIQSISNFQNLISLLKFIERISYWQIYCSLLKKDYERGYMTVWFWVRSFWTSAFYYGLLKIYKLFCCYGNILNSLTCVHIL